MSNIREKGIMNRTNTLKFRIITIAINLIFLVLMLPSSSQALTANELFAYWYARYPLGVARTTSPSIDPFLLAKAAPDECFFGIGDPSNSYDVNHNPTTCSNAGGASKVNQAYVWGMAKSGKDIWFGTVANTHCLVSGTYFGATEPTIDDSSVCEYGESQYSDALPPEAGDWRPPRIFIYDTQADTLTEKTGDALFSSPSLMATAGLRSVGTLGDVVILAGPALSESGGVNFFAFNITNKLKIIF